MRVITGRYRGMTLSAPDGDTTRPITDRAKETLFSILGSRFGTLSELPEVPVLDLFAGSGALGIESLSRGAASCVFVERNRQTLATLKANLAKLKHASFRVSSENIWTMRLAAVGEDLFGLIFVDPPYRDSEETLRIVDLLERLAPRLAPDGVMVFRSERKTNLPTTELRALECVDERVVGTMRLMLLTRREPTPADDAAAEVREGAALPPNDQS